MTTTVAIDATARRTISPNDSRHEHLHCPTAEVLDENDAAVTVRAPNGEVRTFDLAEWDVTLSPATP